MGELGWMAEVEDALDKVFRHIVSNDGTYLFSSFPAKEALCQLRHDDTLAMFAQDLTDLMGLTDANTTQAILWARLGDSLPTKQTFQAAEIEAKQTNNGAAERTLHMLNQLQHYYHNHLRLYE